MPFINYSLIDNNMDLSNEEKQLVIDSILKKPQLVLDMSKIINKLNDPIINIIHSIMHKEKVLATKLKKCLKMLH